MPLERVIENEHGNKVAIWHLTESVIELMSLIQLSDQDLNTVNKFKLDKRKQEWICSRLLFLQLTNVYPKIEYTPNGKPFLNEQGWHISISHTKNYVAVTLSDQPTALDIEIVSGRVKTAANRFIHDNEWSYIDSDYNLDYLTLIWCAKETLYKYFDEFGVVFKEHFLIKPFHLENKGQLHTHCGYKHYDKNLTLKYEVTPNYTLVYHLNK